MFNFKYITINKVRPSIMDEQLTTPGLDVRTAEHVGRKCKICIFRLPLLRGEDFEGKIECETIIFRIFKHTTKRVV